MPVVAPGTELVPAGTAATGNSAEPAVAGDMWAVGVMSDGSQIRGGSQIRDGSQIYGIAARYAMAARYVMADRYAMADIYTGWQPDMIWQLDT